MSKTQDRKEEIIEFIKKHFYTSKNIIIDYVGITNKMLYWHASKFHIYYIPLTTLLEYLDEKYYQIAKKKILNTQENLL